MPSYRLLLEMARGESDPWMTPCWVMKIKDWRTFSCQVSSKSVKSDKQSSRWQSPSKTLTSGANLINIC